MAMQPKCKVCGSDMQHGYRRGGYGEDVEVFYCKDHDEIDIVDAYEARITTLETEITALRRQVAALQAAPPREPLVIDGEEHRTRSSFVDRLFGDLTAGTVAENATVEGSGTNAE